MGAIRTAKYIPVIAISTLVAAFSFFSIVKFTNPKNAGIVTIGFLYASVLLCSFGISSILGIVARRSAGKPDGTEVASAAFRQGVLIAVFTTCCLALSASGLLQWWVWGSLLLLLLAIETFLNLER
jgi:hypothetical protein